jgi:N-terminal domain of (some) glycogen debranching enzymes
MTQADPLGNVPGLPGVPGITVVEGHAFMIADPAGDARPGAGGGLFHCDTRFLSGFRLEVDGRPPDLLAGGTVDAFSARIYLRPAGRSSTAPVPQPRSRTSPPGGSAVTIAASNASSASR